MLLVRYHVEYLQTLLALADIPATAIYSQLDPAARKINTAKFASRYVIVINHVSLLTLIVVTQEGERDAGN